MTFEPKPGPAQLPLRRQELQEQSVGRDLMVYDPLHGKVHVLNPTAALIFRLSDGTHDLDFLERELRASFEVSRETNLRSELLAALESLREKGLLR